MHRPDAFYMRGMPAGLEVKQTSRPLPLDIIKHESLIEKKNPVKHDKDNSVA